MTNVNTRKMIRDYYSNIKYSSGFVKEPIVLLYTFILISIVLYYAAENVSFVDFKTGNVWNKQVSQGYQLLLIFYFLFDIWKSIILPNVMASATLRALSLAGVCEGCMVYHSQRQEIIKEINVSIKKHVFYSITNVIDIVAITATTIYCAINYDQSFYSVLFYCGYLAYTIAHYSKINESIEKMQELLEIIIYKQSGD